MTRYFFNVRNGQDLKLDEEGADFDTLDLAIDEAVASAREIVAERVKSGELIDGKRFEITTEAGEVVHTIPFRATFHL